MASPTAACGVLKVASRGRDTAAHRRMATMNHTYSRCSSAHRAGLGTENRFLGFPRLPRTLHLCCSPCRILTSHTLLVDIRQSCRSTAPPPEIVLRFLNAPWTRRLAHRDRMAISNKARRAEPPAVAHRRRGLIFSIFGRPANRYPVRICSPYPFIVLY